MLRDAEVRPTSFAGRAVRATGVGFSIELHIAAERIGDQDVLVVFAENISERHHYEVQLNCLAFSDALTGQPNRAMFGDRLRQVFLDARRSGQMFAVLMADLDGVKTVNDAHGHNVGDLVLQVVAQRLHKCIREADTLARLGGDEFAALLPRLRHRDDAARADAD